ncbi:Dapper-like protein 1 Dapper antagonist of catenin 1 [Larimichthys crocea]|uniref:Dapper-like protein 1 Dapper antagonist of catenin 1 n=1 Tax=Larimichthys crocea TaxID=215358 RepID=A0A6G0IW47_LARCR|nr:Dapper-like protein 1 Dapper antagonist of catenin 1 [Larimichthys crocea]
MHRAFSFPVTVERSRTKERLEASLAGLCELELRKQRQECLVLGALALGDPLPQDSSRGELACFSSWGQENLTLRRQLSALQSSPWGLMQALEQQVGELRIDTDDGCYDGAQGDTGDSRPSSGFYELSEGQSPKGRSCSTEPTETVSSWAHTNDRPKSVGDPLMPNGELDLPIQRSTLPRSFSAPYPPLEGIAEEGTAMDSWQWDPNEAWQQTAEGQITEEDYQQALRVEGYILSLIQRHTLAPRPCQPRTTLSPDPTYCSASGHSSLHRRTPSLTTEQRLPDPHLQPHTDLSANPKSQGWGCDLLEGEACGGEAPSLEEDYYLALPYPHPRPHSLAERLPSPLPSLDPNCGVGALDLCCEPQPSQHYLHPQPPIHHKHNLVSAQYIPGQGCHAPVRSPRHYNPEQPKTNRAVSSPDHPNSKSRTSKKSHNERQRAKKSSSKTSRSQSENSLLGQRVLPERRYSTTERHQGRGDLAHNQAQTTGPQVGSNNHNGSRRWCSNLELSQDEGETLTGQAHRRTPRKSRHGHPCPYSQPQNYQQQQQQHTQRWHPDFQERAPLCQGEEGYAGAAPAESESSMSEVYSPASSSLSSDSDESGGLVWPQQLPPRLASTSSSSSPSPQATANTTSQPKAFVKIKASHALKKKILRFRSGSLKVMTTV